MYLRIAETLRQRIGEAVYRPGVQIPSEAALCREFSAARNTVRRALAKLQDEKLIDVRPGLGRFVRDPNADPLEGIQRTQYEKIAAALRTQIEKGAYLPGSRLPSELTIRRRFGVSRYTAQRAFKELENAGLVVCIHGVGRLVRGKTSPDDPRAPVDVH
ncbi:GntR family transcriptional regulator [Spirillospora sp. NPDC127200]